MQHTNSSVASLTVGSLPRERERERERKGTGAHQTEVQSVAQNKATGGITRTPVSATVHFRRIDRSSRGGDPRVRIEKVHTHRSNRCTSLTNEAQVDFSGQSVTDQSKLKAIKDFGK